MIPHQSSWKPKVDRVSGSNSLYYPKLAKFSNSFKADKGYQSKESLTKAKTEGKRTPRMKLSHQLGDNHASSEALINWKNIRSRHYYFKLARFRSRTWGNQTKRINREQSQNWKKRIHNGTNGIRRRATETGLWKLKYKSAHLHLRLGWLTERMRISDLICSRQHRKQLSRITLNQSLKTIRPNKHTESRECM